MFIDQIQIRVTAGRGGHGSVSFRRERFVPKGGADGGDGGTGGNVLLQATIHEQSLARFHYKSHFQAENGVNGMGKKRHGRGAEDLVIPVPVGTVVRASDTEDRTVLADLTANDQTVVLVRGGRPGRGNTHFVTSINRAPRMAEDGIPGEYGEFDLELKIPAEVGLVGMPNAGKSTFLTTVTKARPEIGAYPFTTKLPQPGIVECDDFSRFTIMDVPGLLKGAVAGAGAGTEFLRHLERCKMIAYVVDISPDAMEPAWDALQILRDELQACKKALLGLAAVVIANKIDEDGADENLETLRQRTDLTVYPVSAILGEGCPEAIAAMKDVVKPPLPK